MPVISVTSFEEDSMEKSVVKNEVSCDPNRQITTETTFPQKTGRTGELITTGSTDNISCPSDNNMSLNQSQNVYKVDNMERDEDGRLVVQTSELAITVIHVDDDPDLSPWTFRTFFIGKSSYIKGNGSV